MNFSFKKSISSNRIALIASTIVCLFTVGLIILLKPTLWMHWFTAPGVIIQFLGFFLVFRFLVNQFIEDRIILIYKSIYTQKKSRADFLKKYRKAGLLSIEQDVQHWLEKREVELEKMKEQEAYRKEFLGNVSHELKTPIFNIQGYISTLLDGAIDDSKVSRNYLNRTEASIERMISIINDLEVISQLENDRMALNYSDFDIVLLAKKVLDDFEMSAKDHRVTLFLRNKTGNTPMVCADSRQIEQVLSNLVSNSIRYCDENEPYVKITIYDMHEKTFVEVSDNGTGVSERDLPRLFERFYRTDKARSREKGGSGLGLAIVKHIIESHNQNMTVRSALGKGSTFGFTLDKSIS